MSGTHKHLFFWCISRCFASKNHTWGLGPMEASISDARHAVLHAENHRWGLGSTETCYSGPEVAVLHAKTTGEVWVPYRLVIQMLKLLFSMHKTTGFSGTPRDLLFWSKRRCFACKKYRWGLGPKETSNSSAKVAVLHAQNHRRGLEHV